MLTAVDTKTGEKMTDDSIVDNVRLGLKGTGEAVNPHLSNCSWLHSSLLVMRPHLVCYYL
jgi:hypothetical protein